MRHTCIADDGGTPNRRCDACAEERKAKTAARAEALAKDATALRVAAIEFTRGLREPVTDQHDRAGMKRDEKLRRAAIRYALTWID
jgi:hypothetical protein